MSTNLHVDDDLLNEAKKLGGFKTKRETVEAALRGYVDYRKRLKVLDAFGTIDFDPTYDIKAERRKSREKLEKLNAQFDTPAHAPACRAGQAPAAGRGQER